MPTEVSYEMSLEELRRELSVALGPAYLVTATSDCALKVRRFPMITARVRVKWCGDTTQLQIIPGGVWILQGLNALCIAPKVRHAVARALVGAA